MTNNFRCHIQLAKLLTQHLHGKFSSYSKWPYFECGWDWSYDRLLKLFRNRLVIKKNLVVSLCCHFAFMQIPSAVGRAYCFAHVSLSLCRSVGLPHLEQLIIQERFDPESSNVVHSAWCLHEFYWETRRNVKCQGQRPRLFEWLNYFTNISCLNFLSFIKRLWFFSCMKYKKRLLLRCIHHFKLDLINNMDHMRISGTEPSSVVLSQRSNFKSWKEMSQTCQNKVKLKVMVL